MTDDLLRSVSAAYAESERPPLVAARRPGLFSRLTFGQPTTALGLAILASVALLALLAPVLGTVDPTAINPSLRALTPSSEYWFGTDTLGRDVYSRVLYGARVSLTVGFAVAFVATTCGTVIGLMAGFVRWLDAVLMRVMDGLMSIPSLLLAIALMALTQPSVKNVVIAISLAEVPRVARLIRSVTLSLREQAFVDAAITSGSGTPKIVFRHILPNAVAPLIVQATFICASAMIVEAVLSFVGAGTPANIPSWGGIMAEARTLWQVKPHILFFPAAFLSVTVLAVNMVGDGLRDALDPRLSRSI